MGKSLKKRHLVFADLKVGDWYIPWVSYRFEHSLHVKIERLADRQNGNNCNCYSLTNGLYGIQADCDKIIRIDQPPKEYCLPILKTSNQILREILTEVGKYRRKKRQA